VNSVTKLPDSTIAPGLRLPVYPIAELVGVSFKHEHLPEILTESTRNSFFEVHAENYMGGGGPPHHALELSCRKPGHNSASWSRFIQCAHS